MYLFTLLAQSPPPEGSVGLEIPIGNLLRTAHIAEYIGAIFRYGIGLVGIIGTTVIVFGGMRWLLAAGDPGKIKEAKTMIQNAVIGIILALTTTIILNTINPELLKLRELQVPRIKPGEDIVVASSCPPGIVGCLCANGTDEYGEGGTCTESGAKCVRTTTIFEMENINRDLFVAAVGGQVVGGRVIGAGVKTLARGAAALGAKSAAKVALGSAAFPITLLTTAGTMLYGTLSHFDGLYYCTDGSIGQPCESTENFCQTGAQLKCHSDKHICYPAGDNTVPRGGLCEDDDECIDPAGKDYDCHDSYCRGDGGTGDSCTVDADCEIGESLRCLKPPHFGIGRCSPASTAEIKSDTPCAWSAAGGYIIPTRGNSEDERELRCVFCSPTRKKIMPLDGLDPEVDLILGYYRDKDDYPVGRSCDPKEW